MLNLEVLQNPAPCTLHPILNQTITPPQHLNNNTIRNLYKTIDDEILNNQYDTIIPPMAFPEGHAVDISSLIMMITRWNE